MDNSFIVCGKPHIMLMWGCYISNFIMPENGVSANRNKTKGLTGKPEYNVWHNMKQRCFNPNNRAFNRYGGRGITVCEQWKNSFQNFFADMGPRPSQQHSIDRIDNDGNYEPGNCRWGTHEEQNTNTRWNRVLEYDGKKQSMSAWGRELLLGKRTIYHWTERGYSMGEIVSRSKNYRQAIARLNNPITFNGRTLSARAWSRELCVGKDSVRKWLKQGISMEDIYAKARSLNE